MDRHTAASREEAIREHDERVFINRGPAPARPESRLEQQLAIEDLFLSEEERRRRAEDREPLLTVAQRRFWRWRMMHPVASWALGILAFLFLAWLIAPDEGRDAAERFTR